LCGATALHRSAANAGRTTDAGGAAHLRWAASGADTTAGVHAASAAAMASLCSRGAGERHRGSKCSDQKGRVELIAHFCSPSDLALVAATAQLESRSRALKPS
jgi:hypothetical protein